MSMWIVSIIILFCLLQIEVIYLFIKTADINKTIFNIEKYMTEIDKKIDQLIDMEDGTKDIQDILGDMLNVDFKNSDNPYQE